MTADGIVWHTETGGVPGRLTFSVYGDGVLNFFEGDKVEFYCDGKGVFSGFVFTKKRDRRNIITVTAYDQTRYLKNKDTYVYSSVTASELLRKMLKDVQLEAGEIDDTDIVLNGFVEEEKALIDIVMRALEFDRVYSGKKYVLYDDFGKVCLKESGRLDSGYVIDKNNTGNFSYCSSIDEDSFTAVKVRRKGNKNEVLTVKNDEGIKNWGFLQELYVAEKDEDLAKAAEVRLKEGNKRTRRITVENVLGNTSVRAGSSVFVSLDIGDIIINDFFTASEVTHKFYNGEHIMDVVLKGGEFVE